VLDGTKTLLCQPCVGRICLFKARMILGKNWTDNNGTNGKLDKIDTFSKLGLKIWGGS